MKHYGVNYSAVLTLDAHTCDFVAGSVISIRNYFRPRNGLPEPSGSISVALKSRDPGIVSQARLSLGVWPVRLIRGLQVCLVPGQLNISCPLLLYLPVPRTANTPTIPFKANIPDSPFLFLRPQRIDLKPLCGLSFAHQRLSNHQYMW